jgi:hypothetical protein
VGFTRFAAAAAGAALLALGGCGGSGESSATGGGARVATVTDSAASADAFATKAELAWLRRLAGWSAGFADAGARVQAFESDRERFDPVLAGDRGAFVRYRELLEPIRSCGRTFRRAVGRAPTDRLREAARNYVQSCAHFRAGVDLLLEAIEQEDDELAQKAREQILEAGKEAALASGTLPPGEKQELPVARPGSGKSRIDPLYGRAASSVAEKDVEVRCWVAREWRRLLVEEKVFTRGRVDEEVLGFASAGGARVNLSPTICGQLDRLVYERERARDDEVRLRHAVALVVLAHEARHASGIADEPTAECEGIQTAKIAAARLGLPRRYAERAIGLYWLAYPELPAAYRSPECRPGGELDLDGGSPDFP